MTDQDLSLLMNMLQAASKQVPFANDPWAGPRCIWCKVEWSNEPSDHKKDCNYHKAYNILTVTHARLVVRPSKPLPPKNELRKGF